MMKALLHHPCAGANLVHEIYGPLLEHARLDDRFDLLASAALDDDGLDALAMQQLRQQKAGRPRVYFASEAGTAAKRCGRMAGMW